MFKHPIKKRNLSALLIQSTFNHYIHNKNYVEKKLL